MKYLRRLLKDFLHKLELVTCPSPNSFNRYFANAILSNIENQSFARSRI